jgi:energy-coupling factor transport system ATP-binding protein
VIEHEMDASAGKESGSVYEELRSSVQLRTERPVFLRGGNFSGRTRILRLLTGIPGWDEDDTDDARDETSPLVYVGPEIYNALSGLAPTVEAELLLHTRGGGSHEGIVELHHNLGLVRLYERNPFTLSGGEQVCLAVVAGLSLDPAVLSVDCALEQLDPHTKCNLLSAMTTGAQSTASIIADNRLSDSREWHTVDVTELGGLPPHRQYLDLAMVDPSVGIPEAHSSIGPASIELRDITFGYTKHQLVIRRASIELSPGQLYYLCGRNGSGKSTLAKLMSGVLKPTEGDFIVDQSPMRPWLHPGHLVSYHFQNPDLQLFATTVEDELAASMRSWRCRRQEQSTRLDALLMSFGLHGVRAEHPLDLPFVVRKRVALAAAIASGTPWVILDEPTLGQDDTSSIAIAHIIRQLLRNGTGVIVITHSEWFRQMLPGACIELSNGELNA